MASDHKLTGTTGPMTSQLPTSASAPRLPKCHDGTLRLGTESLMNASFYTLLLFMAFLRSSRKKLMPHVCVCVSFLWYVHKTAGALGGQ